MRLLFAVIIVLGFLFGWAEYVRRTGGAVHHFWEESLAFKVAVIKHWLRRQWRRIRGENGQVLGNA